MELTHRAGGRAGSGVLRDAAGCTTLLQYLHARPGDFRAGSYRLGGWRLKITIDVDCTSEEARQFLGLPDVKPMQDALMKEIQDRMMANLQAVDAETLFKTWLPAQLEGFEQMQKFFWSQFSKGGTDPGSGRE